MPKASLASEPLGRRSRCRASRRGRLPEPASLLAPLEEPQLVFDHNRLLRRADLVRHLLHRLDRLLPLLFRLEVAGLRLADRPLQRLELQVGQRLALPLLPPLLQAATLVVDETLHRAPSRPLLARVPPGSVLMINLHLVVDDR